MATTNSMTKVPYIAGATLVKTDVYRIVKMGAADKTVIKATAATEKLLGVLQDYAASGQAVSVAIAGVAKVKLGDTVTRGARLTADSNGAAVATTTPEDAVIGLALAPGVAGDVVEIQMAISQVADTDT